MTQIDTYYDEITKWDPWTKWKWFTGFELYNIVPYCSKKELLSIQKIIHFNFLTVYNVRWTVRFKSFRTQKSISATSSQRSQSKWTRYFSQRSNSEWSIYWLIWDNQTNLVIIEFPWLISESPQKYCRKKLVASWRNLFPMKLNRIGFINGL